MIACVLIPYFAAAVERRAAPTLAGLPLVIAEPAPAPDRVLAVSQEAARAGVRPGMSWAQARALCPQARRVPAQPAHYRQVFEDLLALLAAFTGRVEGSLEELAAAGYLDLGPLSQGAAVELARDLGRRVREQTGLAPALGLDGGRFPARLAAASTRPHTVRVIAPGQEAAFLAPHPIDLLPLDEALARRFHLLGLSTLGQLAALPVGKGRS